ncbi:MAG: hypothetical protein IT431_03440, partial [Phycisphaerales bacterium]|nr:hypothetical protein [Phycisphaerales bacterium]
MPFAISPPQAALLEALVSAPSITAYAQANNIPLTNLALWLQQPEIAAAHAALLDLRALDRRTHHDQLADEALEVLRETMKASEDPIERRRCATTV